MDLYELKKEQLKLASRIILRDNFDKVKTLGGIECLTQGDKILASVVICDFPSLKILEKNTFVLHNPLPYRLGFDAYREMPAMIEAFNMLEHEPDVLLVKGNGINHPRRIGLASHLGLVLNISTIGVSEKLNFGKVDHGKIIVEGEISGFEVITKEYAKPIYVSPGHLISLGSVLNIIQQTFRFPHKLPEPLHLAHKIGKKKIRSND